MLNTLTLTAFCVSALCALASARTQLTDGTAGKIIEGPGFTTMGALQWQSSGVLWDGCTDSAAHPINISTCFALQLSADPTKNLQDDSSDSPRQRIEFLTAGAADGTSWSYQWKYYLSSQTGTTNHFFHLMQILTRGGSGGPVITLNAAAGKVAIQDTVRGCPAAGCPSIALNEFTDRTTTHSMTVTYGPSGSVKYTVKDSATSKTLLTYSATGSMGTESTSLKFGTYRLAVAGMTVSLAAVGDFSEKKL
ncbi:hypothetical protein MVEN_00415700 [Mycena venus]|uniref:Uncharacterized protein n=1 Tax=Mycena venus TaxID=2733690 RepID=A0A8H7DAZ3_9AGAR|nr:hypothetical protein MVEN_00415700 [Mycena venus]